MLLASRRVAFDALRPVLAPRFSIIHAEMLSQAERLLREKHADVDFVVATVGFDESRMFDLIRFVKAQYPEIPFIASLADDTELSPVSLEGVRIACEALGAETFLDIAALRARYGEKRVSEKVCAQILERGEGRSIA